MKQEGAKKLSDTKSANWDTILLYTNQTQSPQTIQDKMMENHKSVEQSNVIGWFGF